MRFRDIGKPIQRKIKTERNKAIIEEHKKGKTEEQLAKEFNIHHSHIHVIVRDFYLNKERK